MWFATFIVHMPSFACVYIHQVACHFSLLTHVHALMAGTHTPYGYPAIVTLVIGQRATIVFKTTCLTPSPSHSSIAEHNSTSHYNKIVFVTFYNRLSPPSHYSATAHSAAGTPFLQSATLSPTEQPAAVITSYPSYPRGGCYFIRSAHSPQLQSESSETLESRKYESCGQYHALETSEPPSPRELHHSSIETPATSLTTRWLPLATRRLFHFILSFIPLTEPSLP